MAGIYREALRHEGYEYFDGDGEKDLVKVKQHLKSKIDDNSPSQEDTRSSSRNSQGNSSSRCGDISCCNFLCCDFSPCYSSGRDRDSDCNSLLVCGVIMCAFIGYIAVGYSLHRVKNSKLKNNWISVPASIGLGLVYTGVAVALTMVTVGYIAQNFQEYFKLNNNNYVLSKILIGFHAAFFAVAAIWCFGWAAYKMYARNKINNIVDELLDENSKRAAYSRNQSGGNTASYGRDNGSFTNNQNSSSNTNGTAAPSAPPCGGFDNQFNSSTNMYEPPPPYDEHGPNNQHIYPFIHTISTSQWSSGAPEK